MKKILYFVCIMLFGFSVKASVVIEYQNGIYSNRILPVVYSSQMAFIHDDDKIIYSLDPYKMIGINYYENSNYINKFSKINFEYFELVAYFGYNKTNRNSIYYYMAAQELIWNRIIGGDNVYWTTGDNDTGTKINVDSYKKEISNDIDNYYHEPNFGNKVFTAPLYEELYAVDKNNVLDNYDMIFSGNSVITREKNKVKIKFYDSIKQTIMFTRSVKSSNKTIFYSSEGYQTLASLGINTEKNINLEIIGTKPIRTKVNLTFYDESNNNKLDNVDFRLCDEFETEMTDGWVNDNGKYIYNGRLNIGKYSICSVSSEYIANNTFSIEEELKEETDINIYLKRKIIENNIPELIDPPNNSDIVEESKNEILDSNEIIQTPSENEVIENNGLEDNRELPNTSNYNLHKYMLIYLLFIIGLIIYEKKNIRN